ncbi:MAG: OmpA family protein [Spirochaetes bacterium]|nr:OmpA family protein [Spirochaetota bacterium]
MNKTSSKQKLFIIFFSFALIIPFYLISVQAQKQNKPANQVRKKPAAKISYKNYIWIEGENSVDTNFAKEKTYNFFCSGRFALQLSKDTDPASDIGYYATYVFYVPGTKTYDFWMGCTPPGSKNADKPGYASPVDWKIDNSDFKNASSENTFVKEYYAGGGYYWTKISTGTLSAGKHTLTIRVNQKRSSGWDYYFYIDAIVFIPTYSEYLTPLMNFPEVAPGNFSDKSKSLTFADIESYKKRIKANPNDREAVFTSIQIYTWLYDYEKSIDLCREYLKRNQKDIEIRILLASTLAWADRLDEAIREYNNIIAIDKKNITARKLLAVLAGWNNRYDEAIKNYREIVEIDRMNIDAYISLATQYSWKNEPVKAFEIFRKAESIAPNNIEVLYALGDNYYWTDKTYEATQQFKKIISIDEKEIEAYKKLARIYISTDRGLQAKEVMEEAARIASIYPELSGFSLDIESEISQDRLATIEQYKINLEKNPDDIEKRKNLIDSYIWNKMDAEAVKEYNNLLNVKVVKGIEQTDEKIANLALESVKQRLSSPNILKTKEQLIILNRNYERIESLMNEGKKLPDEYNENKIKNDLLITESLAKKVDLYEQNLSYFNDVISYYDKDIQSYLTRKNALKWKFDRDRIIFQAAESEKMYPQDFRPKKVAGVIEYLYGSVSDAYTKLGFVHKANANKAFPLYLSALSELSDYSAAVKAIDDLQKNKNLRGYAESLKKMQDYLIAMQAIPGTNVKAGDSKTIAAEISRISGSSVKRLDELMKEEKEKIRTARTTVQYMYEKMFLDNEIDNVNIYNEIANYNLNRGNQKEVLDYYSRILAVQPLNVEINYKLGAQNQALGYWKSAMQNFELCINNDPDNQNARAAHYELQKEHSPSLKNELAYFKDKQVTRINNELIFDYPLNNFFSLNAGYGFRKIDDNFSASQTTKDGQEWAIAKGTATRHSGLAGLTLNLIPWKTNLFLNFIANTYKGKVDFEIDTLDSDISYTSLNYSARIDFPQFIKGLQLKFIYALEDEAEQTQSLKLNFRDAITSKTYNGLLDLTFQDYNFPLSDRIFLYDSYKYKKLSDGNTRTSSYNQLSFRVLKIPSYGLDLDISGINSYEASKFIEYTDEPVANIPYWAPEKILTFGAGIVLKQTIDNIFNGKLSYELSFQYTRDSVTNQDTKFNQTGYTPGFKLTHSWDKVSYYVSYLYSQSKSSVANTEVYKSQSIEFGLQGRFYTVYTPAGTGGRSIVMASASTGMITPDGDGRDDFAIISLTSFDEKGSASWEFEVFSHTGEKVKSIGSQGSPPASVRWDGTDKANNPLPEDVYHYQLTVTNSAGDKNSSKREAIFVSRKAKAIAPELSYTSFSPNGDNIRDSISIELKATDKDNVASWTLLVMDRPKTYKPAKDKERKAVRTIRGFEFLPYSVEWDGKDNNGKVLPDGDYYININVKYGDGKDISSPDVKADIVTKAQIKISASMENIIPAKTMLRISPESSNKDLSSWKLSFYSPDEKLLKIIQGSGKLPEVVAWNGTDENNNAAAYNMPVTAVMDIADMAGNKGVSNKLNLWLGFLEEKQKDFTLITLFNQGILHKRKDEDLTQTGKDIVKRLIAQFQKHKNSKKIRVVGHTSSDGSSESNLELSRNRARNLGQMIKDGLKLETGVININGMGKSMPSELNDKKWDDRYEIEIY